MATVIFTALVCIAGACYMYREYGIAEAILVLVTEPLAIALLSYIENHFTYKAVLLIVIPIIAYCAWMEFSDDASKKEENYETSVDR